MRSKKEFILITLLFVTISIFFSLPILQNIKNWGVDEWNIYIVNIATQVDTILEYHQIPLWTPYKSGGSFLLAHPMSMFLSPFFILPLLAGPIVGMKISFLVHLIVGLFSMYLLARYLKMGIISSCFASFIFCLNTRYTLFINRGDFEFMPQVFFPLVFLFYLKFINERSNSLKYLFWGAVLCSLIFLDGGVGYFVFIFVLLAVFTFVYLITGKGSIIHISSKRTVISKFLIFILVVLCLSAIKLIPALEVQHKYPRLVPDNSKWMFGYDMNALINGLINRDQRNRVEVGERAFCSFLAFDENKYYVWEEYGAYIGLLPLILYIVAIFFFFKRKKDLILASFSLLILSISDIGPISIWKSLQFLPIFNTMRCPTRYIILFLFALSLLLGILLSRYEITKKGKIIISLIMALVVFDLILVNRPILSSAYATPPKNYQKERFFYQEEELGMRLKDMGDKLYPTYLSNKGYIWTYNVIQHPIAAKGIENSEYKGEAYLAHFPGESRIKYFSPNKIITSVKTDHKNLLVLNQNYDSGWKVKGSIDNKVINYQGLIATEVDNNTSKVEFYYSPISFKIGLFITFISYGIFIVYFVRKKMFGVDRF